MTERKTQTVLDVGCLKVAQELSHASIFNGCRTMPDHLATSSNHGTPAPFQGLMICVTGLSKDTRRQVQEATRKMGGHYSPDLHPNCTHLVVQSFHGRKFEHAFKYGLQRGLFIVTLSWFVNCVKQNVRLDESQYSVKHPRNAEILSEAFGHLTTSSSEECSLLPATTLEDKSLCLTVQSNFKQGTALLEGMRFYMDSSLAFELKKKVMEAAIKEGGTFTDHWFIGCEATHVVCEVDTMLKYLGFNTNLVTPLWILKTIRERKLQRVMQLSADLARHISLLFGASQSCFLLEDMSKDKPSKSMPLSGREDENDLETEILERKEKISAAKAAVRKRRGPRMQPFRALLRPITPSILLDSICWSITDPPSAVYVYIESSGDDSAVNKPVVSMAMPTSSLFNTDRGREHRTLGGIPENEIHTRPISVCEREEIILKDPFLTILFPMDRFDEVGPSSRTFFSEKGFQRQQMLEFIYGFYQEVLSPSEVDVAIHLDSKHADRLRSLYGQMDTIKLGYVPMKKVEFLGTRLSFEGLKRIGRDNSSRIYELLLGA